MAADGPSPLATLPALLRDEPGLTRALGEPQARLAIVEVARPISIAALAHLSNRRPLVVACPTGTMAGQLYDDLCQFLGADEVAHFPAGRHCRSNGSARRSRRWASDSRCCGDCGDPRTLPAGDRRRRAGAAAEARARERSTSNRSSIRPNSIVDPDQLAAQLVEFGYRREELVEHRGEFARRGAIVDVYPSTADAPIRIDLWGDEVDRLTVFGVNDQRSTVDLDEAMIFPARELMPTDDVRDRANDLVATEPWGREQWERLAEGAHFDGMESWVPWLVDDELLITDVLARRRQGGADRATPDARPGRRPARRGGRPRHSAWRRRGRATRPSSSHDCTPTPTRCWPTARRSGRSTRRPSRPTRRSCRHRVGARSAATAPG